MEFLTILLILSVYMFPALVAGARKKQNTIAIFLLNVLLGWTGIFWIIALIWACMTDKQQVIVINNEEKTK